MTTSAATDVRLEAEAVRIRELVGALETLTERRATGAPVGCRLEHLAKAIEREIDAIQDERIPRWVGRRRTW